VIEEQIQNTPVPSGPAPAPGGAAPAGGQAQPAAPAPAQ